MKNILFFFVTTLTSAFTILSLAQTLPQYTVLKDTADDNAKMLVGIIDKTDLMNDTSFNWYAESQRIYPHPDTALVNAFRNNKEKIYFLFFGGTWCEDTHFILPKFYQIQEASGFPENRITVFALTGKKMELEI